jgi:hypothetical protein
MVTVDFEVILLSGVCQSRNCGQGSETIILPPFFDAIPDPQSNPKNARSYTTSVLLGVPNGFVSL